MREIPEKTWHVIASTVRGGQHIRNGLPNQDAVCWRQEKNGLPIVLALADGHGSTKYFRSDIGAHLAVTITVETIWRLIHCDELLNPNDSFIEGFIKVVNPSQKPRYSMLKRLAEVELPRDLAQTWRQAVRTHFEENPITPGELEKISKSEAKAIEINPEIAYGCTVLAAAVGKGYVLFAQLGDGDILAVSGGEVIRPVPPDDRLFANETTSLCSAEAWRDFRIFFQVLTDKYPDLIMVSTDGYANSFKDDESFLQVAKDLLMIGKKEGLESIEQNLPVWLSEASDQGSGDDITLGLIVCERAIHKDPDREAD
ncbi:MAG: protein phosphatase 2C domain-containing protein [Firmicutes bacterium]|nr:protein phosphatase 2C domain-containing protein [Bacillota bacterium]